MKTSIYCKVIAKGQQAFYLDTGNREYLLFIRNYRKSNCEFFGRGQELTRALSTSGVHSRATLKTIERLLPAIRYIEKTYDISVLNSTVKKSVKKKQQYKRHKLALENEDLYTA